nr:MAG: putative RNA-dependent RNA polymerase [Narnaviridae sp.]
MNSKLESPLRSLDAEHHNQASKFARMDKLETSFMNAWNSNTVQNIKGAWVSTLSPKTVFQSYANTLGETFGPTLDTHPLEDVYKAVKIISQYAEMTFSYVRLLDQQAFAQVHKERFSNALHSFLGRKSLAKLVGFTAGLNKFGKLEKYCKWSTANLWAWGLRQNELPPVPEFLQIDYCQPFLTLCPSKIWCNIFDFANKVSKVHMIFTSSYLKDLYNCKGAAASVGPEFIKESLQKHKEILTTPKQAPIPIGMTAEGEGSDLLLGSITHCATVIFGSPRVHDDEITNKKGFLNEKRRKYLDNRPPSRFPSLNSSYNFGRHKGGAGGEILSLSDDACDNYCLQPEEGYFYGYATHKSFYFEVRTPYDPEIWYEAEKSSELRAVQKALSGYGVDAQVIPLSEPFKVRTITKGDCDMYHLARRWQKVIHKRMRKQVNSSLMGKPCSGPFLSQIFYDSPHFDYSNLNGFFVSGDYESATDLLNPSLSLWAQNEISNRLCIPIEHQRVLNACLTEHNLYYGEKRDGQKVTHKQTWGQLMGSPTSFPVLCLINLAATKLAYDLYSEEITGKKSDIPMADLPMCVNGDDILFWCHSDRHYQIWKDVTANAGLKFSLGKNYTSRKYCIINSEMYRFRPSESLPFKLLPCMNTRLLEGGNRSTVTSVHPLHVSDQILLLNDPSFDEKIHLSRFCKPLKRTTAAKSLKIHFEASRNKTFKWQELASWFQTIEQRRSVLIRQATEVQGDNPLGLPAQQHRAKLMEKTLDKRFAQVQIRRLNEFRGVLGKRVGQFVPDYLPQSLGGFGFPKGPAVKYTALDVRISALAFSEPKRFKKLVVSHTPSLPKAGFMDMVSKEINFISKYLNIEKVVEIQQYSSFKAVDEGSFFELPILSGFLSPTNLTVEIDELEKAYRSRRNFTVPIHKIDPIMTRIYNKQVQGSAARAEIKQIEADLAEGVERRETIILDGFANEYHFHSHRPYPKL